MFAFKYISMLASVNNSTNGGNFIYSNSKTSVFKTKVYTELRLKPGFNHSVQTSFLD